MEFIQSTKTPRWNPISFLAVVAEAVDGQTAAVAEQAGHLARAESGGVWIDPAELTRMEHVFAEAEEMAGLMKEQLRRWRDATPTHEQLAEIERVAARLDEQAGHLLRIREFIRVRRSTSK